MTMVASLGSIRVSELAAAVGGTLLRGDGERMIGRCSPLDQAGAAEVSFVSNVKYTKHLESTGAGCVILTPEVASRVERADLTIVTAKDPYFAFRQAIVKLHGFRRHPAVGVSPLAAVAASAKIGKNVNIHPFANVGENVVIGDNCHIYSHVTLMADVQVGSDCILYPGATVYDRCVLGERVILQAGAVIGSDGYGFATNGGVHHKIPQVGNVVVEDDVEIGACTVIERAAMESTRIGKGSKLGNSVVIGHNCTVGEHNLLVSQVGIAGSTKTGRYVVMAGQVGVAGHLTIADQTRVAAQGGVIQDILEPGMEFGGAPAMEAKHARRVYLNFVQLPELAKRLKEVEKKVGEMGKGQ